MKFLVITTLLGTTLATHHGLRKGALPLPVSAGSTVTVSVTQSQSASAISGAIPIATASGAKCGKGYTYCGFMLQSGGHNFAAEVINKTYCDALEGNCVNGVPKTKTDQAVFLCMDDNPASIQLFCACSGKCLDEPATNNIAHCDAPCYNGGKCF